MTFMTGSVNFSAMTTSTLIRNTMDIRRRSVMTTSSASSLSSSSSQHHDQRGRRAFYSTSKNQQHQSLLAPSFRSTSLNLTPILSPSTLDSIVMLPEIQQSITSTATSALTHQQRIDLLNRARDVFSSFPATPDNIVANRSLVAVLLLLAHRQDEASLCKEASKTIRTIRSHVSSSASSEQQNLLSFLMGAQAKAEWKAGDFREAERLAMEMGMLCADDDDGTATATTKICHLTALGLSRLMLFSCDNVVEQYEDDDEDDTLALRVQRVLDPLEQVVSMTAMRLSDSSNNDMLQLATAQALGNYGIAQSIAHFASLHDNNDEDVPQQPSYMDKAMESWKRGVSIVDTIISSDTTDNNSTDITISTAKYLKANLECCVAQSILFPTGDENEGGAAKDLPTEQLTVASHSCRDALFMMDELKAASDGDGTHEQQHPLSSVDAPMGQALSLVASCYTMAGSAVTAQGLFQSALDKLAIESTTECHPYSLLWHRDALTRYADLCQNWENREGEAKTLLKSRDDLKDDASNMMGEGWKYQPGILGGLWFFSPGDHYLSDSMKTCNSAGNDEWRV